MNSRPLQHWCGFSTLPLLLVVGALVTRASAQCSTQWLPGQGIPGTNGPVHATTMWDRDGFGPIRPVLVLGGQFTTAGTVVATNLASFDPVSRVWSVLGSGVNGDVQALTTLPNGDLIAGGLFSVAGGFGANNIARWNGTSWFPLGAGMNGRVKALTTLPNGDLVAGGDFATAGGVNVNRIARWNGTSWSALGTGVNDGVDALVTLANGDLVAGGNFTTAGTVNVSRIARWDGTSWSALGSGMDARVNALTTLPNGDVVAGGAFTIAGGVGANHIARWDGTSWSSLGSGMSGSGWPATAVRCLVALAGGNLVAGGVFTTAGGVSADNIARWDGAGWAALGGMIALGLDPGVHALTTLPNGDLVAGGGLMSAGIEHATNVARWNGSSWSSLGLGLNNAVLALTAMPNGDFVAGGRFGTAEGRIVNYVARWNGTNWSRLGAGLDGTVYVLKTLPNGDLIAGGYFWPAAGPGPYFLARWDGTNWSVLPGLFGGHPGYDGVFALTTLPNGDLVAGGNFRAFPAGGTANNIARWNGTSWSAMGTWATPALDNGVWALTTLPNGDVVAAGQFTTAGGVSVSNIARWDGTSWSPLGTGVVGFPGTIPTVTALTTLPNGDLVAGGYFWMAGGVPASCIARWDGTNWSPMGSGMSPGIPLPGYRGHDYCRGVWSMATLPNGDVVAAGTFTTAGGLTANNIARWDGTSWSPLGLGMSGPLQFGTGVNALTQLPNGDLVAGGAFTIVGGAVSAYVARLTTTCAATAASSGAGCTGSGGPNVLTATTLPWTGSTFRSVATGMPGNGLALGVLGLSTISVPLSSILPQGVAGCTLFVNPDLLDLLVLAGGSAQAQFAIPNTVVLAGQTVHQQVVPVELDLLGNIIALTSTNRLTLTIGTF